MPHYQPLVDAQIRLLTILPGQLHDKIECTLLTRSLDEDPPPRYEALSYVWGNETDTLDIMVDGSAFAATRNLVAALCQFRYTDEPRVVWADAICINQRDMGERSSQVLLMGRIYSECRVCQAWLGDVDDHPLEPPYLQDGPVPRSQWPDHEREKLRSYNEKNLTIPCKSVPGVDLTKEDKLLNVPGAFEIARIMAANKHTYEWPFYRITKFPDFEPCPQWDNAHRSLISILSREWWKRTWTVQESILPKRVVINIGPYHITLYTLMQTTVNLRNHVSVPDKPCCDKITSRMWSVSHRGLTLSEAMGQLTQLYLLLSWRRGDFDPGDVKEFGHSMHLLLSRKRKATNLLDAIYGYLGILPFLLPSDGPGPDYSESVESLYARVTKQFILRRGDLNVLKEVQPLLRGKGISETMSSWAMDWLNSQLQYGHYHSEACGSFAKYERTDLFNHARMLPIDAMAVGTVIKALPCPDVEFPQEFYDNLEDIYDIDSSEPSDEMNIATLVQTLRSWREAAGIPNEHDEATFWRVILKGKCDILSRRRKDTASFHPGDLETLEAWWNWMQTLPGERELSDLTSDSYPDPSYADIEYLVEESLSLEFDGEKETFCVLDSGHLAMLPRGMEVGDRIVVAKGFKYPMVIGRRWEDAGSSDDGDEEKGIPPMYNYLGIAYVDGIMNGEAVADGDNTRWELLYLQ